MKTSLGKIARASAFSLSLLSLAFFFRPAHAASFPNIGFGQTVNFSFRVSCTDTDGVEKTYKGQKVNLFKEDGFYLDPFNIVWIPLGQSIVSGSPYSAESNSEGRGELLFAVNDILGPGKYQIGIREGSIKIYKEAMTLNDVKANPRGKLADMSQQVYYFNTGSCSSFSKPELKPTQPVPDQKQNKDEKTQNYSFQTVCSVSGGTKAAPSEKMQIQYGGPPNTYEIWAETSTDSEGMGSFTLNSEELKNAAKAKKKKIGSESIDFTLHPANLGGFDTVFIANLDKDDNFTFKEGQNSFNTGECSSTEKPAEYPLDNKTKAKEENSDYPEGFIENLKGLFKDEAQLACEGKDPNWQVIYPDYKPTLVDRCVGNATGCYNSGILEAFKNNSSGDLPAKCIEQALNLNMSLQPPTNGTTTSPTVTNPRGDDGKTIDNDLTTPDTGTGEAELNEEEQPPQGGPGENPEGQPEDETQADVPTQIIPYINGESGGLTVDVNSKGGTLDVGARLTATAVPEGANWTTDDCVKDNINMWLRKVDDKGQSQEVTITSERSDTGEKDTGLPAGKFQNCQSYKVSISGPGTYLLSASYDGGQEGRFTFKPADVSGTSVKVLPGAALIPTASIIDSQKTQGGLTLTPKTQAGGDASDIPVVSFKVVKVTGDGQAEELYSNDKYPNGEPKIFSTEKLGGNINHIEATVIYSGAEGFAPSENSVNVDYASEGKAPGVEEPYVWLTTDPNIPEIFPTTPRITLIAATNSVVENPHFEITRDSETTSIVAPDEKQEGCKDGVGSCVYKYTINLPQAGHYSISFKNGDVSDHKEFTLNTKEEGQPEVSSIELLYNGNSYDMSSGSVDLDLEPGENVLERVIHTSNGDIRKSFKIIVEEETAEKETPSEAPSVLPVSEPSGEPPREYIKWYCQGDQIIEEQNGETKPNRDCRAEGLHCRSIAPPEGIESDAECYYIKWYCENNNIIEESNGVKIPNRECGDLQCVSIPPPPYALSDADCVQPGTAPDQQPAEQAPVQGPPPDQNPQPDPVSSIGWFCREDDMIMINNNGNIEEYYDCREQKDDNHPDGYRCEQTDPPEGFESDAECV